MRRKEMAVALTVIAGSVIAACGPGRPPVKTIATVDAGVQCTAQLEQGNVSGWKEVRSEGFTFCVPRNWKLDAEFQRLQSVQRPQIFRRVSWAAPDSTQRVVIDIPTDAGLPTRTLQTIVALCGTPYIVTIGAQTGCISYPKDPLDPAVLPMSGRTESGITNSPNKSTIPTGTYLNIPKRPMSGAAVQVVFSDPLIQMRAVGSTEAWRVVETVRPIPVSHGNH